MFKGLVVIVLLFAGVYSLPQLNIFQGNQIAQHQTSHKSVPRLYETPAIQNFVPQNIETVNFKGTNAQIFSGPFETSATDNKALSGLYETPVESPSALYGTLIDQEPTLLYGTPKLTAEASNDRKTFKQNEFKPPTLNELANQQEELKFSGFEFAIPEDALSVSAPETLSSLYQTPDESIRIPIIAALEDEPDVNLDKETNEPEAPISKGNMMLMPFNFDWHVRDEESENAFSHLSSSDGFVTQGEYSVLLPDGRLQTVRYSDDGTGYKVKITYT